MVETLCIKKTIYFFLQGFQLALKFSKLIVLGVDVCIKKVDGICEFLGLVHISVVKVYKESIEDGNGKRHRTNSKAKDIQEIYESKRSQWHGGVGVCVKGV